MRLPLPVLLTTILLTTGTAWADDAGLRRCRALADAGARLACYDALPLPAASATAAAAPTPAAAVAPAPAALAAVRQTVEQFGLEQQRAVREQLDVVDSHIPGRFEGWGPKEQITLANGQVWQIVDDSRGVIYATDAKVRVRRGALGTFFLEFDGSNRSPKVRRVR